jgi:hypothetical protein
MKTCILKLSFWIAILFTFFGCCEDCNTELNASKLKRAEFEKIESERTTLKICQNDPSTRVLNEDLTLKFNCRDQENFQHLHIDLVNRFSILGKIKMDSNKILSMDVIKKEVGTCNYLKITNFKYTGSTPETDRNGKTFMVHDFDIELVDNMDNTNSNKIWKTPINYVAKVNDVFDIHINSKANIDKPETYNNGYYKHPWTNYGQQFCKSSIIMNP